MIALLLASVLSLEPAQMTMHASSPHYTVDVLDAGSTDTGARLLITRTDTTRYHIVTVNRALGRVNAVRIRSDEGRVIAITDRGFAVIEPAGRAPQDEVYGYGVKESQDARWIAYMRDLRDEQNSDAGDAIVMYDTMRTPDQNRAAFPIAAERSSAAGTPVYPPAGEWRQSSGMEPARLHAGLYEWWSGPLYAAALRTSTTDRVVVADLSQPGMRVCTKLLPEDKGRWNARSSVTIRQRDGNDVVEIRSEVGGIPPEIIVFPANCGS